MRRFAPKILGVPLPEFNCCTQKRKCYGLNAAEAVEAVSATIVTTPLRSKGIQGKILSLREDLTQTRQVVKCPFTTT